jgi:hypothetical protein
MFVPRYSEQQARDAIAVSSSYAEALRPLDLLRNWWQRADAAELGEAVGHLHGEL